MGRVNALKLDKKERQEASILAGKREWRKCDMETKAVAAGIEEQFNELEGRLLLLG